MKRRKFLRALGLAPLAAPLATEALGKDVDLDIRPSGACLETLLIAGQRAADPPVLTFSDTRTNIVEVGDNTMRFYTRRPTIKRRFN